MTVAFTRWIYGAMQRLTRECGLLVIALLCFCAACEELGSLRGGFSLWHSEGRDHHEHYDCKELVLALACSRRWKCSQLLAFPQLHLGVGW